MRQEVQETGRLILTVPPQEGPVSIEIRFPRIRGRKATVIVESRNWHVQSAVVHPKRVHRKFQRESRDGTIQAEE